MKCGLCGKSTMLGFRGEPIKIYGADMLNHHKRREHPTEFQAARVARQAKTETTKQAKAAEAQRVSDARLAASRPVVVRQQGVADPVAYPSSAIHRWQLSTYDNNQPNTDVRFPAAEPYQLYQGTMGVIAVLEAEAKVHLTDAWERGTPVTLEDLEELDRAVPLAGEMDHAN